MDAADQPTIKQLLDDFDLEGFLGIQEYNELLAALEQRDNIMRTDAVRNELRGIVELADKFFPPKR